MKNVFFDYSEGIDIVNPSTGELTSTSLFCGVMAMSSMTFGGVTPYVTVDNQKAAVDKAHWYDPDVNPTFVDFADHWGLAVIPAWPYKPRDKGANESGIGVIQKQFFQEVRDKNFYPLLKACPITNWEQAEWSSAKVHADFNRAIPY